MEALGHHYILECYECDVERLNHISSLEHHMQEAAKAAKATVITSVFHSFSPHGTSGIIVLAESHLSIHTWPEHAYAAIDIFVCGEDALPKAACDYLADYLRAQRTSLIEIKRGQAAHLSNPSLPHNPSPKNLPPSSS